MNDTIKATKLETLGAWLGLWTPPRGVAVPPVPWRKVAIGAAGVAALCAVAAVTVVPAIDEAKDERSAKAERDLERRAAARRARIERMQRPRFGEIPATADRRQALTAIGAAIGDDARARFSPKARRATCEPAAGVDPHAARVAYDCFSARAAITGAGPQRGARGQLAYPYRAIVDFGRRTYAFCRVNPQPGEQGLNDPRKVVQLPSACVLDPARRP